MFKKIAISILLVSMLALTVFVVPKTSAQPQQRGPRIDTLRFKVVTNAVTQLIEMTNGPPNGADVWTSEIKQVWPSVFDKWIKDGGMRPSDIEEMDQQGKTISYRSGYHFFEFGFNYRIHPLDDVNFRHALAHLVPKDLIIGNLFRYTAVKIDSPTVPIYPPIVDPHLYSPAEAEAILHDAGYQKIGGVWKDKDGTDLPKLRLYCPHPATGGTTSVIAAMLRLNANDIGLMNIELEYWDFQTYMSKVYRERDFDIAPIGWVSTRFASHLWRMFYSENNYYEESFNPHGIVYPELDAELSILYQSLEHSAKVTATRRAQELLMGGTPTNPLPHNVQSSDPRYQAIPVIPIYSRKAYDAQHPDLRGAVNMFGYGINNIWTWMNIRSIMPGVTRVVSMVGEFIERLNPLWARSVYTWHYADPVHDGLFAIGPYFLRDIPWLATTWEYMAVPSGMDVTFDLKLTDSENLPIKWQDGKAISVDDVKFSWDFLRDWGIPAYSDAFRFYSGATIIDADTITAHMTTTSPWLIYDLASTAYMLPPQVWTVDPRDGEPWANQAEIRQFDPSSLAYPTIYNVNPGPIPLPTQLFGTGPFILQNSTDFINLNGQGDLAANRNYWLTTQDMMETIEYMFWRAGDVVDNDKIDIEDLSVIAFAYLTMPGDPWWNPDADITGPAGTPPDGIIDIDDLATAGKFFGETETVPYEHATPP